MKSAAFIRAFAILGVGTLATLGGAQSYNYVDLNGGSTTGTAANGVSDSGAVAGYVVSGSNLVGNTWDSSHASSNLTDLGGGNYQANAIGNTGEIVGNAYDSSGSQFAVYWSSATSAPVEISRLTPNLTGYLDTATSVSGTYVAGYSNVDNSGNQHAWRFDGSNLTDLGVLGTATSSQAFGVNSVGTVVGANLSGVSNSAFYDAVGGAMTALTGLSNSISTGANGISDNGIVVGFSSDASGNSTAVYWDATQAVHMIAGPAGFSNLVATAISSDGSYIIGNGTVNNNADSFVLHNGVVTDILAALPSAYSGDSITVTGVNTSGDISGFLFSGGGNSQAFLLTPQAVPAPASIGFLAVGLVGLVARKRRA